MKPVVNDKQCYGDPKICTAKTACPQNAFYFEKVEEPMWEKEPVGILDRCPMGGAGIAVGLFDKDFIDKGDTKVGRIGVEDNPIPAGDPYIRTRIDYDKCTKCGLCVDGCCGYAIHMVED